MIFQKTPLKVYSNLNPLMPVAAKTSVTNEKTPKEIFPTFTFCFSMVRISSLFHAFSEIPELKANLR